MVLAAGAAVAVVQPGDLGDEESASSTQETTTTVVDGTTTSTTVAVTTTVAPTTTVEVAGGAATTTTIGGSGLGVAEPPSGGSDGVADTGGESMLGPGMALAALGLALRRLRLRHDSNVRPSD